MVEKTQTYWNELLDKYRIGTISEEERYLLEKQALDDPFLFDALEGFTLYENGGEENVKIKTAIKIFTLPRIAAAASLVFLVAVMINLNSNKNSKSENDSSIAMVLENEDEMNPEINGVDNETTATSTTKILDDSGSKSEKEGPDLVEKNEINKKDPAKTKRIGKDIGAKSNQTNNKPKEPKKKVDDNIENDRVEIVEEKNQVEEVVVAADMPAKDDEIIDQVLEEASELKETDVSKFSENAQRKKAETLPVTAASNSEKERALTKKKKSQLSKYYEAVPVIGKKIFDDYAKERIDERGLRQEKPQEVTIEFTIDKNGNLTNFHHIFTGCSECGPFAISVLQNSGEWKTVPPGFSGRARYTFIF